MNCAIDQIVHISLLVDLKIVLYLLGCLVIVAFLGL